MRACLGVAEDDQLIVAAQPGQRELAIALTEAGYRAGARYVEVVYVDPRVQAARIRSAREQDLGPLAPWTHKRLRATIEPTTANVTILPIDEAGVFDGLAAGRIQLDHARTGKRLGWLTRASTEGRRRWTGVAWPSAAWAARVYPELEVAEAERRLARDLLWFCRLSPEDPPGVEGWLRHVARIAERASALTDLRLERLELRDGHTALDLRLVAGTRWLGGPREQHGRPTSGNFPTEENFTSPDPRGTEGTFRCSRPLAFRGRIIEGIAGEFRGGQLVRLDAATAADRDFLAAALDVDPGARRLGEVALVDRSSRIGQTGHIYLNTLLDENAAAHIAFGRGFKQARLPDATGRVNASSLHLDVMIGTDELEATGVAAGGRRIPLIAEGEWRL